MQTQSKKIIGFASAAAIAVVAIVLFIALVYLPSSTSATFNPSAKTVYFTIIESDQGSMEGMNGSFYHSSSLWPVITVTQGENVVIYLYSRNSSEPHGFSIFHYFSQGVALEPGGSYVIRFVANQNGTFLITCPIFCVIHPEMDHGELIVKSNSTSA